MYRTIFVGSLVGVLCATGSAAVAADALRPAQLAAIDAAVRRTMLHQHLPSVVIEVNRNGKRVFARAWGRRNVADGLPATVDTLYQYGSITKQFTAMCIFLPAQDGKLALDDRTGKYLPAFAYKAVSIRQLLIHTSGLPDPVDTRAYDTLIAPQIVTGPQWILSSSASAAAVRPLSQAADLRRRGHAAGLSLTIPDRRISVTMLNNLGGAQNSELTVPMLKALLK